MPLRTTPDRASEHPVLTLVLPWLAVLIWASLIYLFSSLPSLSTGLGAWDLIIRKIAHMGEFTILATLLWSAIGNLGYRLLLALPVACVLALLYAVSDEYHQQFVPGRNGSARDVVIDAAGITMAVFAILCVKSRNSGKSGGKSR